MNKRVLAVFLFPILFPGALGAQDWSMPNRTVELGLDVDGGFGNSLIKIEDVFNIHKTLLIDLKSLPDGELFAGEQAAASAFINVNIGKDWSFGVFAGTQVDAFQSAPKEVADLLRKGNAKTKSVDISMSGGGSAFVDAGIKAQFRVKKLRLTVKPAAYVPLIYVPPPEMDFDLDMDDSANMSLKGTVNMDVYSAFSLEEMTQEGFSGDIGDYLPDPLPLGFDMTLEGLYSLLPVLDLGLGIANVPLYPSHLRYRMHQDIKMEGNWTDMYDTLTAGDFDLPEMESDQYFEENATFLAFRPLRFDFFAEYRPVEIDLFVIRPHIGFSVLTIYGYDTACFNIGLDGQINIVNLFSLSLGTGYVERMWKHSVGIRLNFRAIELDLGVSLRGPDIVSSFKGKGLGASLGIRLGF
ncbi:MAG: hypothetical protein LBT39_11000 [Treponema sp.]|nr:hypothetical protein [Treponema sp.]